MRVVRLLRTGMALAPRGRRPLLGRIGSSPAVATGARDACEGGGPTSSGGGSKSECAGGLEGSSGLSSSSKFSDSEASEASEAPPVIALPHRRQCAAPAEAGVPHLG